MNRKLLKIIIIIFILGLLLIFLKINHLSPKNIAAKFKPQPTPPPPPQTAQVNGKTIVKYPEDYTLVLLGDSLTERLGNSTEVREDLHQDYPGKTFEVLNYGYGSTNILSALDRLTKTTNHAGRDFRPILDIDFSLILIESFGNNPLSQYPLDQGLQIQNQTLDQIVQTISQEGRRDKIVFVATIAPNSKNYAKPIVELSDDKRAQWAKERAAYIENHIKYAKDHNIPVIDIYHPSLKDGDGNLDYIDPADFIHPSPKGIEFISQQIADQIHQQNLLK